MILGIHAAAGVFGFLTILTFWTSTAASELFGSHETIATVKQAILWGMLVLVPSMAAAGGTGFKLLGSRTDALALAKKRVFLRASRAHSVNASKDDHHAPICRNG